MDSKDWPPMAIWVSAMGPSQPGESMGEMTSPHIIVPLVPSVMSTMLNVLPSANGAPLKTIVVPVNGSVMPVSWPKSLLPKLTA